MDQSQNQSPTLETFRDPLKREEYHESASVKLLYKNLSQAANEGKKVLDSYKRNCNRCKNELEATSSRLNTLLDETTPEINKLLEGVTEKLRSELIAQQAENMKMRRQIQTISKENEVLTNQSEESQDRAQRIEKWLSQ